MDHRGIGLVRARLGGGGEGGIAQLPGREVDRADAEDGEELVIQAAGAGEVAGGVAGDGGGIDVGRPVCRDRKGHAARRIDAAHDAGDGGYARQDEAVVGRNGGHLR